MVPDLAQLGVMVLPLQAGGERFREMDLEIQYALEARGGGVRWVFPGEMNQALERSPALAVRPEALSVAPFSRGEVQRVGDPLFGELRRLAALMDGDLALLPVEARTRQEVFSGGGGSEGVVGELVAVLVNPHNGRVYWFAVLEGDPGAVDDHRVVASLAESLAGALVP